MRYDIKNQSCKGERGCRDLKVYSSNERATDTDTMYLDGTAND